MKLSLKIFNNSDKIETVYKSEMTVMWIVFAFCSALFAGLMSILAKYGIKKTDSTVATAIRTIVVLLFSWLMVLIVGSEREIGSITPHSLIFLILSGLATGASWLCYFKALQLGDINKVVPIDKSSTVLTILLAAILLGEKITLYSGIGIALIAVGTFLMIERKDVKNDVPKNKRWIFYAFGSALFASLTAILGKIGISDVESNLGTAIRTGIVLVMSWVMVFVTGKQKEIKGIAKKNFALSAFQDLRRAEAGFAIIRRFMTDSQALLFRLISSVYLSRYFFHTYFFARNYQKRQLSVFFSLSAERF